MSPNPQDMERSRPVTHRHTGGTPGRVFEEPYLLTGTSPSGVPGTGSRPVTDVPLPIARHPSSKVSPPDSGYVGGRRRRFEVPETGLSTPPPFSDSGPEISSVPKTGTT